MTRTALLAALAGLAAGCGSPPAPPGPPVTGKVVYRAAKGDNRRLQGGRVEFQLVANPAVVAVGTIGEGGEFSMGVPAADSDAPAGVPPGEYRVRVLPPQASRDKAEEGVVPARFQQFATSKLTATVPPPADLTVAIDPR